MSLGDRELYRALTPSESYSPKMSGRAQAAHRRRLCTMDMERCHACPGSSAKVADGFRRLKVEDARLAHEGPHKISACHDEDRARDGASTHAGCYSLKRVTVPHFLPTNSRR